jgi:CIC family chloride channel protein
MPISKLRLLKLFDRLHLSETTTLLLTAIVVGAGTGLGAVLFIKMIAVLDSFFLGTHSLLWGLLGAGVLVIAPVLGALISGPVIAYFAKEAKGHGVPEVMQAIALRGGRIRPRVVVAKVIASAFCIGSGGSAGREGPIVQVGAALGSTIGQWLHLSEARIRNLVACGAAAGIAATFNAPMAGVVFAMEIILGELHLGDLGNVVISAVTSSTVARIFLGDRPAFAIPNYAIHSPWEIVIYAVVGLLAGLTAVGFIRVLYWFEGRFDAARFPESLKPAAGAFILGWLGLFYWLGLKGFGAGDRPEIFGTGFPAIEAALNGELPLIMLLALVFLKPLATSLTLGSGNSGGVMAPTLLVGAALGGAVSRVVEMFMPGLTAGPGAFAVVGMAAVFAGAARAPFTAILIVFEMTNDYRMILPLMTAVIISLILAERLLPDSIYTLKLTRRGIRLKRGRDLDVMETVGVDEVMVASPVTVAADMPVTRLGTEFLRTGRHGFPVLNADGSLFGVVSLEDYRKAVDLDPSVAEQLLVRDIATQDIVSVYPDETVDVVLQKMAPRDISRLPVVARDNPRHLVGVVRRNDIVRAYELGALRREEARNRIDQLRALSDTRTRFIDIHLTPLSSSVGKTVSALGLPHGVIIVSIHRGRDLLIPNGDTELEGGDQITLLCKQENVETVRSILAQSS